MKGTEALLALTAVLDQAEAAYMIVGSYSSNFYGIPRSTKDADLVVSMDAEAWKRMEKLLPDELELESQTGFEMVTSTRKDLIRVKGNPFEIELFHLSRDDHDRERFARRRQVEIAPGIAVFLPTAEDVIVQKMRWCKGANRAKDFSDTVAVMQVQGKALDWAYIESWCEKHGTLDVLAQAKAEASLVWDEE